MPPLPTRIDSTVVHTRSYEPASMFTQARATRAAPKRIAALPLSVRRKSRSGASRLRAQAVRPASGRELSTASAAVVVSMGRSAPVTECAA